MDGVVVKQELAEYGGGVAPAVKQDCGGTVAQYIELSSSDSDYGDTDDSDDELDFDRSGKKARVLNGGNGGSNKKQKLNMVLPLGFLDPLPREQTPLPLLSPSPVSQALPSPCPVSQALPSPVMQSLSSSVAQSQSSSVGKGSKQFWKAGDYDDSPSKSISTVGMDHVRVHPKFLHSNATSHKWALGAFAELLDNSLDEVCYGATFVNIDMMYNKKDGSRMLLIEDNGGGMDPDKMRQCMSLGYSAKSKLANVIGQYGNGFKTSTMRLGADVIVFSRCCGKDSMSPTQSIGMLSYTFLKSTGKEDIVVPMLDYEKEDQGWKKLVRSSSGDWNRNAETIVQWSPYSSEAELFHQFNQMSDHGTRIIIYNLWEDDQGELELDFCANQHDIQIRGVNRDEKKIEMARQFPNSRHFLTYRHSLRSYASILYLRLPPGFRIVLRGKDVEHHNIVNDMMLTQEVTYRPTGADGVPKDPNMVAIVRIGFVKDAKDHIDVQGFNVYHKNRLIKPFWRVWNAAGSDGRGVIGVLEANFVEPAHDKQGFERTTVLQRLESRLIQMQKTYWSSNCHKIGYAPRRHKKLVNGLGSKESSPEHTPDKASACSNKSTASNIEPKHVNGKHSTKVGNKYSTSEKTSSFADEDSECEIQNTHSGRVSNNNASAPKSLPSTNPHYNQPSSRNSDYSEARDLASNGKTDRVLTRAQLKAVDGSRNGDAHPLIVSALAATSLEVDHRARDRVKKMEESFKRDMEIEREKTRSLEAMLKDRGSSSSEAFSLSQLRKENDELRKKEESLTRELQLETDRCKSLEAQLKAAEEKMEELNKEQEALINIFAEERDRREDEESNLRRKLKDASMTIQHLVDKVMLLEKMKKSTNFKPEKP